MFERLFDDARALRTVLLDNAPGGRGSIFSSGRLPYQFDMRITSGETTQLISMINLQRSRRKERGQALWRRQFDADLLKDD